jgi:hypothetical protein
MASKEKENELVSFGSEKIVILPYKSKYMKILKGSQTFILDPNKYDISR